jgi:RHS repeat-associated protein
VDASENLLAKYSQGAGIDEPLSELRSGAVSYYEQDGLGSVTSLSGSGGALANTYTYDSFGNLTSASGAIANPYQYTGRDYDPETGLRYYRARYYDSMAGRFISEDPAHFNGGGVNFYRYVNNNPPNYTDSMGLAPDCQNCRVIVRCRGIESYNLWLIGAQHCDARVWDSNGTEHSLSGGPDAHGDLNAWNTTAQSKGGPLDPFTGDIIYYNARAKCDTANCVIDQTVFYNSWQHHPKYHAAFGPNSNIWLDWTFKLCGINLDLNWFGPPIFSLPVWQGK